MANPNIVNVSQIYGKTVSVKGIPITETTFLTNAVASGKILKINTLMIANKQGTSAFDISVVFYDSTGATARIASTISVPADATLVLISKDTNIYLEEGDSLTAIASADSSLDLICSYEEIS